MEEKNEQVTESQEQTQEEKDEAGFEQEVVETEEEQRERKMKNLVSVAILLGALFVGSLFVDIAQLVSGKGFSQRVLQKTDVFESGGKTWVAFSDPVIKVQVVTDDSCEKCNPAETLVGLKKYMPTILTEKIDAASPEGKELLAKFNTKGIPAFIFSKDLDKTDFFAQAKPFFENKDDLYYLKSAEAGIPVGKYVEAPKIDESSVQVGNKEAKVKIVQFSDFQCPYCKKMHETVIAKILKDYGDKVEFVWKNFPLPIHPQAEGAALAAMCANEQGKFIEFADKLFATQDQWGKTKDTNLFKGYARTLGLNSADFNKCLDDRKYADQIKQESDEAQSFGISGTPATFVDDQFFGGLATYDDLKKAIDEELAK